MPYFMNFKNHTVTIIYVEITPLPRPDEFIRNENICSFALNIK